MTARNGRAHRVHRAGLIGVVAVAVLAVASAAAAAAATVPTTGTPTCKLTRTGAIYNGTFEQTCPADPTVPGGWQEISYGAPGASFSTTSNPEAGASAATTTISAAGGEAGWRTSVVNVRRNQRYSLKFDQAGSTYVYAYLTSQLTDGTTSFASLMAAPATGGVWSTYRDWMVSPPNVASMQLTIASSGVGTFTVDNVDLAPVANQTPSNFSAPMVSLSFDDDLASTMQNGIPILAQDGLPATFFVNGSTVDTTGYMSSAQIRGLAGQGDEIGSHLYHHSDLVAQTPATITSELKGNVGAIDRILGSTAPIAGFASPYGSFTSSIAARILRFHQYHRDTDGELNTKANLDLSQIHGRLVTASTSTADIAGWIAQAVLSNEWLVLVYHGIDASSTPAQTVSGEAGYTVSPTQFADEMSLLQGSGVQVATIQAALALAQSSPPA